MADDAAHHGSEALSALDRALSARPERDGDAFAAATGHLCRLRELLLAQGRDVGTVNAIVSGSLAGHFPLGETPWPLIESSRAALAKLCADLDRA